MRRLETVFLEDAEPEAGMDDIQTLQRGKTGRRGIQIAAAQCESLGVRLGI
jgi:hypothetical protein